MGLVPTMCEDFASLVLASKQLTIGRSSVLSCKGAETISEGEGGEKQDQREGEENSPRKGHLASLPQDSD